MDYVSHAIELTESPDNTILHRIAALKFCGVWHTPDGDYAVFDDRGSSGSSFLMQVGETLGECMQRRAERYDSLSPMSKPVIEI